MPSPPDVAIIGAGAAGLMTAITAARRAPSLRIILVEGMRRPGAKILVSGGGRCNVTNRRVKARDFHGDRRFIDRVLRRFGADDTIAFFASLGVELKVEEEFDKLFPADDRARGVLDALLHECTRLGVTLLAGVRVESVKRDGVFVLEGAGSTLVSRCLVLATGGRSLPQSGSDGSGHGLARALGHSVTETWPALVALVLEPHPFASLAGVSFPAEVQAWQGGRLAAAVRGPALVTHFGLSGPAVLDVSRHFTTASPPPQLRLNLFPGRPPDDLERDWIALAGTGGARAASLLASLPARLGRFLLEAAGVAADLPLASLDRAARRRLLACATGFVLPVVGSRGFRAAEVTAGGVPLAEVDPKTMASRAVPGLYLVGEILDVDGRIGGFNFQWAWTTGFIAGEALAAAVDVR